MAYRILRKVKDGGSPLNSLYQFVPTTIDGVTYYLEFNTKEEIDEYVEKQLNLGLPKTSLEVVAPMKYTVSASIEEEECGCEVPSTNPKPTEKAYQIIANPVGGVVERGTRITFIIDGDRNKFVKLIVDGSEIKSDYYTVTAGSTIVSLVDIYANTLAIGEHTIEFIFSDGKASDKFEITEKNEGGEEGNKPNTSTPNEPSGDEESGDNEDSESENPSDSSNDTPTSGEENPDEPIETPTENEGENSSDSEEGNSEAPVKGEENGETDNEGESSETESSTPVTPESPEDTTGADGSDNETTDTEEPEGATPDDVIIPDFDGL